MASILLECPHCGATKIGFHFQTDIPISHGPPYTKRMRSVLICTHCEEIIIATFDSQGMNTSPASCTGDPQKSGWTLRDTYPKAKPPKCPEFTPDDLKRIFMQADNAYKRGDADASGAMSRKVMDVSTQQLVLKLTSEEEAKKYRTIYARIEKLAEINALTPDLRDWAHQLRLGGNDAAHDADLFAPEEASELLDFAELYLTYVYTLPSRLEERRKRAADAKAASALPLLFSP